MEDFLVTRSFGQIQPIAIFKFLYEVKARKGHAMRIALQDIRFSYRQLAKMPGFALTAIVPWPLELGPPRVILVPGLRDLNLD